MRWATYINQIKLYRLTNFRELINTKTLAGETRSVLNV